ncbi:hypothetical protein BH23GEM3_BH23GEM3_03010 [soil metagenome]
MFKHTDTAVADSGRLEALYLTALLDTPPEEAFDRITRLAARTLAAPVALVSLVDRDRQFFKSCTALPEPWATTRETPLSHSFCQYPVNTAEPLVIEDAREHPLVRDNPAIRDLGVVAYAGIPILTSEGHVLGSFCVIDTKPRRWTADEISILHDLTASVVAEIELRTVIRTAHRNAADAEAAQRHTEQILQSITDAFFALDHEWRFTYLNDEAEALLHRAAEELLGKCIWEEYPEAVGSTFERMYRRAAVEQQTVQFEEYFAPLATWFEVRAYPAAAGLSVYFRNVTDRKRLQERQHVLANAGEVLATSLDPMETVAALARTVVPWIADWCAVYLVDGENNINAVEIVHADPEKVRFGWELLQRYPPDPHAATGTANVVRTGEPEIISEVSDELLKRFARDEEHLRLLQSLGLRTFMSVPLQVQGRVLGVLSLYSSAGGRRYYREDLVLAREIARRAALALDHAQLFTERERALADVAGLAAQRSAILGQIADGVIVTDADGRINFINEAARQLHGVAKLDVPVESYADTYRLFTLEGEPYPTEQLPLARAVKLRESVIDAEWKIRRSDDSEIIAQGSATPVLDSQGRMLGAVLTLRDVTPERRLRQQLEEERARLHTVFQRAPAVIAIYSGPEHTITMVNPAWEVTVGKTDVLGRTFREAFPEVASTGLYEMLDRVYETGEPFVGNEANIPLARRGDGVLEDTYWNFVWQPLSGVEGHVTEILVHAVEVTEQVLARQQVEQKAEERRRIATALERSNQELDQFAYVTSHDLKAPLRGIGNLSQWIEEDWGRQMPQEVRQHLQLLRGRVNRMEGLIDGILQYSRATRVIGEVQAVNVNALVADIIELMDPPENVHLEVQPGLPTLRTERLPLQQIFMNLIGNAIKHTRREDAQVRIQGRDQDTFYEFVVSDNGPGIAPEFHERIFGIFQTLEARDTVEGTGIGLSLVKKIVEHHSGRVWVESEEGAGSAFHFTWPATT